MTNHLQWDQQHEMTSRKDSKAIIPRQRSIIFIIYVQINVFSTHRKPKDWPEW